MSLGLGSIIFSSFDCKVQQDFGHKCGAQVLLGLSTGLKRDVKLCFAENGRVNKVNK